MQRTVRLLTLALLTGCVGIALPSTAHAQDRSRPVHGDRAITLLADRLDEAAALNGWTVGELRRVLATDPTAWVDPDGRVSYRDPAAPATGSSASAVPAGVAPYPLDQTFALHSKPGSGRTIFIDVDGATVSGTAWNSSTPGGDYPAWTLDADATTFSDTERTAVQSIWQRVAEDYAPFDVDVTTQDPGPAGLERSTSGDTVYGTRALVTPSDTAETGICGSGGCGGVAYINVFGEIGSSHQPAWVFPQSLGNDAKNIAEAVSHEVGHNFSLNHDGTTTVGYYSGHTLWAPIMGVGYSKPVSQWSRGEYANASNTGQDDVALIAARAPYRADEAGGTVGTAAAGLPATAYVTSAGDLDTYALGTCSGAVSVAATGAPTSQDLDLEVEILDSAGTVVAAADPAAAYVNRDSASGLNATASATVATGSYYVRVDGVGTGDPLNTGYSDYASVGAYTLAQSGCVAGPTAPGTPGGLTITPAADGTSATVTWTAPADGGSPVTDYTVGRTGATDATQAGLSKTWTGLTPGTTYSFTVRASNTIGTGPAASLTRTMPTAPSTPGGLTVTPAADGTSATVTWTAPSDGGSPLTDYTVGRTGATDATQAGLGKTWTGLTPGTTYSFTVRASNAIGTGPAASLTRTMPVPVSPPPPTSPPVATKGVPGAPTAVVAKSGARGGRATASVRWSAAADGGSPVSAYRVLALQGDRIVKAFAVGAGARSRTVHLPHGRYVFAIVAVNALGEGQRSARTRIVSAR